jgi:hypothetical protein
MSDAAMLLIDYILAKISRGPRPHATLRVWNAALAHTAPDTGALEASGTRLATVAGISQQAVCQALAWRAWSRSVPSSARTEAGTASVRP